MNSESIGLERLWKQFDDFGNRLCNVVEYLDQMEDMLNTRNEILQGIELTEQILENEEEGTELVN